VTMGAV